MSKKSYTRSDSLSGRRALITGGSQGIGQAIALAFAGAGTWVAIASRNPAAAEALETEINDLGSRCFILRCDVTDIAQIESMHSKLESEWGGIDVLVNSAGIAGSHKFLNHPDELWHKLIDVNLNGVYYVTKAFAPGMAAQRRGRIINIASIAARAGGKYIAAYSASKHGVLGLTRSLAIELAPDITVNAICPGYVRTPMTDASIENIVERTGMAPEKALAALENQSLQKRLIEPEEVAAVALLLAGEEGRGITGQAITVDGGVVMV